jgi:hypothetical protein
MAKDWTAEAEEEVMLVEDEMIPKVPDVAD